MPMSADYTPISIQRKPLFEAEAGEGGFAVYTSIMALEKIRGDGPEWKYHDAGLLRAALQDPSVIFEGLKRAEFSEGYCYVSRPKRRWTKGGEFEPVPADRVFLVFVKKEWGLVVFDWEWRQCVNGDVLPVGHKPDFERLIWRR